ncbi:MAG: signal peptidase II [Parcubacteria group bacterium]|nr:signal peptidase II [Parcubacteria group bacterium]
MLYYNFKMLKWKNIGLLCALIFFDRILKVWSRAMGIDYQNDRILNFFEFSIPFVLIVVFIYIILVGLWIYEIKGLSSFTQSLVITLILAGATSNFFDRIIYGYVIDYIHFLNSYFNVSDLYIISGAILIIVKRK